VDVKQGLELAGAMTPILTHFIREAERTTATGEEKKAAVLDLGQAVYLGAQRTGVLDGVKELRGVDWALVAPFISLLIDAAVALFNRLRVFAKRKA